MKTLTAWRGDARIMHSRAGRIAYWTDARAGEGAPWLLLIHGYPTSSWDWMGVWEDIAARFRIAALDMLGFGLSDKPRRPYAIARQADLQEELLALLGVESAHIFAHDYGDTVAQEMLARSHEGSLGFQLRSICFLNGGLFPEQHRALLVQKLALTPLGPLLGLAMTRRRLQQTFERIFGPRTPPSTAEMDAHWSLLREKDGHRVLHRLMRYIPERRANRARWVGALAAARTPLRLIVGGADPVSGAHLYRYYLERIPSPDAVLFEDIGHYPHTEAPDRVAAAFFDFHDRIGTFRA